MLVVFLRVRKINKCERSIELYFLRPY